MTLLFEIKLPHFETNQLYSKVHSPWTTVANLYQVANICFPAVKCRVHTVDAEQGLCHDRTPVGVGLHATLRRIYLHTIYIQRTFGNRNVLHYGT